MQAELKGTISLGVRRRGKTGKLEKVGELSLPTPYKETGGNHPGWNQGDRPPDVDEMRIQGDGIVKRREDK